MLRCPVCGEEPEEFHVFDEDQIETVVACCLGGIASQQDPQHARREWYRGKSHQADFQNKLKSKGRRLPIGNMWSDYQESKEVV